MYARYKWAASAVLKDEKWPAFSTQGQEESLVYGTEDEERSCGKACNS